MSELKEFLIELTIDELEKFIAHYNSEIEDFPESWFNMSYCSPLEKVAVVLSTIYDDETLEPFLEYFNDMRPLYLTMLQDEDYEINWNSIIFKNYKPVEEYYIYNEQNQDKNARKQFAEKYGCEEKFSDVIDYSIACARYEQENYHDFILLEVGEIDWSERKHFMIRKFFHVWDIYKNYVELEDKPRFVTKIIKEHFCSINWTTMSRLYDPDDKEFFEIFGSYINPEFAKKYNPKLK